MERAALSRRLMAENKIAGLTETIPHLCGQSPILDHNQRRRKGVRDTIVVNTEEPANTANKLLIAAVILGLSVTLVKREVIGYVAAETGFSTFAGAVGFFTSSLGMDDEEASAGKGVKEVGSFPEFMLPPKAFRDKIWKLALPKPRTVRLWTESEARHHALPPILPQPQ
ncbi:hypothetical protein HD806DRAFT_529028 [Xylariaceae sp. AK1471]|nr:hypothetical protein HD806DRAFT_529028 [Xylariaceae sp. AK1471]